MRILNGNTKKSTNKYMQSPYPCIYCDHSTEFGSGRFVNRIPNWKMEKKSTGMAMPVQIAWQSIVTDAAKV